MATVHEDVLYVVNRYMDTKLAGMYFHMTIPHFENSFSEAVAQYSHIGSIKYKHLTRDLRILYSTTASPFLDQQANKKKTQKM